MDVGPSTNPPDPFDLLVVGGGINGVGIARDAAGRGLGVALCEQGDLAGATSSASSGLIHGGLRYLERLELRLVRESLAEREVLLDLAPHLVRPLRFVLPHVAGMRPAWMIRLGLWLYDHLGGKHRLPASTSVMLAGNPLGAGLKPELGRAYVYWDCQTDDARLVIANARDAAAGGAAVWTRTRFLDAEPRGRVWRVRLLDVASGAERVVSARCIVNAAGPWAAAALGRIPAARRRRRLRLVKGSHLVVPRVHEGDHACILQNDDGRVVFLLPFESEWTVVGTTDVPFEGDPASVAIDEDEVAYLCRAANRYLARPIAPADVVATWSGVRPLLDDGAGSPSRVTRDYLLELEVPEDGPLLLTAYGGKLTTYRRLAEQALDRLAPHFPGLGPRWTATRPLPGGELPPGGLPALMADLRRERPGLPPALLAGLAARHGALAVAVLGEARAPADLGDLLDGGLTEREVAWMVAEEWAREADDVLRRRSRAWLRTGPDGRAAVARIVARERADVVRRRWSRYPARSPREVEPLG